MPEVRKPQRSMDECRDSVLFVFWHGLGDNILATPCIRHFRKRHPDTYVGWMMQRRFAGADLFFGNSAIDRFHYSSDAWNDHGLYKHGRKAVTAEAKAVAAEYGYDRLCIVNHRSSRKHKIARTCDEMGIPVPWDASTRVEIDRGRVEALVRELEIDTSRPYAFFHGKTARPHKDLPLDFVEEYMARYGMGDLPIVGPEISWPENEHPIMLSFWLLRNAARVFVADSVMYHAAHALRKPVDLAYFKRGEKTWKAVRPLHTTREQVIFDLNFDKRPKSWSRSWNRKRVRF